VGGVGELARHPVWHINALRSDECHAARNQCAEVIAIDWRVYNAAA
jgi:hypothetical protein